VVPATIDCSSKDGHAADCVGPFRRVTLTPTEPLTPGQSFRLHVNHDAGGNAIVDSAGGDVATWVSALHTIRSQDDQDMQQHWGSVANTRAIGGSYQRDDLAGATITLRVRLGIKLWYAQGPDEGSLTVKVDGVRQPAIDEYSPRRTFGLSRVYGTGPGGHDITITVGGRHDARSTGGFGVVDAISVDCFDSVKNCPPMVTDVGRWSTVADVSASSGAYMTSDTAGATAAFAVRGTGFDLYRLVGRHQGLATLLVDGRRVAVINSYRATKRMAPFRCRGLTAGEHSVRVVVRHERPERGLGGFAVSLDRVVAV
jgi:hypothetical protein